MFPEEIDLKAAETPAATVLNESQSCTLFPSMRNNAERTMSILREDFVFLFSNSGKSAATTFASV